MAANSWLMTPPSEMPSTLARSRPSASITALMSSIRCSSVGNSSKRSEQPIPRLSNSKTRTNRDSYSSTRRVSSCSQLSSTLETRPGIATSGGPEPNAWYAIRTPSRLTANRVSGTSIANPSSHCRPTTIMAQTRHRARRASEVRGLPEGRTLLVVDTFAAQLRAVFNERDIEAFYGLLAEDARWGDPEAPSSCHDRDAILGHMKQLLDAGVDATIIETATGPRGIACIL